MKTFKELFEGIKLYHGSRNGHGKFVIGHKGHNSHTFGEYNSTRYGVFFTKNKKFAMIYGEPDKYELHVKKVANLDKSDIIDQFLDKLRDDKPGLYQTARYLRQTWAYFEDEVGKEFFTFLRSKGYDCATFEEYTPDENGKDVKSQTYVLLDLHRVRRNPDPKQPDLFLK